MSENEPNPPATDPVTEPGDGEQEETPSTAEELAGASGEPADIDPEEVSP